MFPSVFRIQPAGPQEAIAEQQRDARQQREWGQKIERAPGELPAADLKSLDEGPENQPLREGAIPEP
jgi:hypothetical protein